MGNQISEYRPFLDAIDSDDLVTFKSLCDQDDNFSYTVHLEAIKKGKLEFVKYLTKDTNPQSGSFLYECAVISNQVEIVKYFISRGFPLLCDIETTALSIKNIDIVDLILSNSTNYHLYYQIRNILSAYNQMNADPTLHILRIVDNTSNRFGAQNIMYDAAKYGFNTLVRALYDRGFPYGEHMYVACKDDIDLFIFFYEKIFGNGNCEQIPYSIIENSGPKHFEYLFNRGLSLNDHRLNGALVNPNVETVKLLHEKGYQWDPNYDQDSYSTYDVDQYCHDNDIPCKQEHDPQDCIHCWYNKKNTVEELWEMEDEIYDSVIQWLPKETLVDFVSIIKIIRDQADLSEDDEIEKVDDTQMVFEEVEEDGYVIRGYNMDNFMDQKGMMPRRD